MTKLAFSKQFLVVQAALLCSISAALAQSGSISARPLLIAQSMPTNDLLPPSVSASGAKVQPTVDNPTYGGGNAGQGYGQGNGQNYGSGGHHHHHSGGGPGPGLGANGPNQFHHHGGAGSGAQGFGSRHGGYGTQGFGSQNYGGYGSQNYGQSSVPAPQIKTWNQGGTATGSSSQAAGVDRQSLDVAATQRSEAEQTYAREASQQIQQIHQQAAQKRQEIQNQMSMNSAQYSGSVGRHNRGRRGNAAGAVDNSDFQRQLQSVSTYEQKQIESIQQRFQEKQRALSDAADHFAAQYNQSSGQSPRLGAARNDLHVRNYEIDGTASGAEVPLTATQKSLSNGTRKY